MLRTYRLVPAASARPIPDAPSLAAQASVRAGCVAGSPVARQERLDTSRRASRDSLRAAARVFAPTGPPPLELGITPQIAARSALSRPQVIKTRAA